MATTVLLRLAALTGEGRYRAAAERALATVGPFLARYPTAFAQWLCALELAPRRSSRSRSSATRTTRRPRASSTSSTAATGRSRSWRRRPAPGRVRRAAARRPGRARRPARRRSSAAASRAACRSRSPRRSRRSLPEALDPAPMRGSIPSSAAAGRDGRPAAAGPRGPEVLLTHRPSTMAFGPGLHVFPGGAVDAGGRRGPAGGRPERVRVAAAIRELARRSGSRSAPDALVPLSRWVTPPGSPRRYDTRFFVAWLPDGAGSSPDPHEVADHAGSRRAMRWPRWPPGGSTCGRRPARRSSSCVRAADLDDVVGTSSPSGPPARRSSRRLTPAVARITFGGAGAIPGQAVDGYLVGRSRLVVVDPGDPSDEAAEAVIAAFAAQRGARIAASSSPRPCPDHAGGAETLAFRLEVPLLGPPGASGVLSSELVADRGRRRPRVRRRRDPRPRDARDAPGPPCVRAAVRGRGAGGGPVRAGAVASDPGAGRRGGAQPIARDRSTGLGRRRLAAHR